jgi:uridine phosphorylase
LTPPMKTPPLPLLSHPLDEPSAFTAEALVSAVRSERGLSSHQIPDICVLEFDGDLTDALVRNGTVRTCEAWACFHTTMFSLEVDGISFGLIPRTIGGPYAVLVAEQLRASGVKAILGLTSAGRVNPALRIPSIVVATAAVRDEGTSFHYLPAGRVVEGHGPLAEVLAAELQTLPIPVTTGTVWTTDAPYRETESQLAEHAASGISAVEMQAASLFAFGAARKVPVGIVAHVTNAIDHSGQPFDKGQDVSGEVLLQAICRAGERFITTQA